MRRTSLIVLFALFAAMHCSAQSALPPLKVSANHRYFIAGGKPFFWLGDTGWLLFSKLTREEAEQYLDIRAKQGFNVIQAMVVHEIDEINAYGDSALMAKKIAQPKVTTGSDFSDSEQYDYWDHIDWIVDRAAAKGIYIAMVPVWGSVVKGRKINAADSKAYATFLAKRYGSRTNIIWMNGGDIAGKEFTATWNAIGTTLKTLNPNRIQTYHPRGRTQSSTWFHNQAWLDFNCFQSGHRTYAQDTSKKDLKYGEDNWRYMQVDYNKKPIKPSFDAEPSYERIPHGLHDFNAPKWTDADVRRYGYWSVFSGGCGYTYGNNDVMQMHKKNDKPVGAYGSTEMWYNSVNDPGARQMVHLKTLMLSRPYFERVPDQSLIAAGQGTKYERLLATRGKKYAFIYTYTGRPMEINPTVLGGKQVKAQWFDPRTGSFTAIGTFNQAKNVKFNPPGSKAEGNDWVLVLDAI